MTELCELVNLDPGLRRGDVQAVSVLLIIRLVAGFSSVVSSVIPTHAGIQVIFLLFVTLNSQCSDVGSSEF